MNKQYEEAAKNIDEISKEEEFYKSGEGFIRGVLKRAKKVNVETGRRIIEGLWNEYGEKSLNMLCDFDIDFGVNTGAPDERNVQKLRDVIGPLTEIKIIGIKVFEIIIKYYETKIGDLDQNRCSQTHESDKGDTKEEEEGELEVDCEGMYKETRSKISKLIQEYKFKEAKEEAKNIRNIPLDERVKMVRSKYDSIGKSVTISDLEAVGKYIKNKEDQKECLEVLGYIRERTGRFGYYHVGDLPDKEKIYSMLKEATKQAIEVNDLTYLKVLPKGGFLRQPIFSRVEQKGYSLFEYACKVYANDCAIYLLKEGGGIEQEFEKKETPLIQALREGNEEIGMFLIERGANCNVSNEKGYTILHAASEGNCFEVAKLLIERGSDIKVKDKDDRTPLHLAAENNSFEVAKLLIEKGADIEAKDKIRRTTLITAVECDSLEVAELLIERGADIEVKNRWGYTPLQLAEKRGMPTKKFTTR